GGAVCPRSRRAEEEVLRRLQDGPDRTTVPHRPCAPFLSKCGSKTQQSVDEGYPDRLSCLSSKWVCRDEQAHCIEVFSGAIILENVRPCASRDLSAVNRH